MPEYSIANIRHTIRDDEFKAIMKQIIIPRSRLFISLLYCTGARPSEVSGDPQRDIKGMTFDDIEFDFEKGFIAFHVPVSKIQKGIYAVEKRRLKLEFDAQDPDYPIMVLIQSFNDMIEIERHRQGKKDINTNVQLFHFCRKTGYNIVRRAGKIIGVEICPYNFRHSRLTQLSEQGAGIETLMYFKGSRDIKSIATYLHAKEIQFKLGKRGENREGKSD